MIAYDTAAFIDPIPRRAGWHDVHAAVTWTPLWGHPVTIEGAFLDASSPNGSIFMGCGIETMTEELGLTYSLDDPEHVIAICELVTVELEQHPWAELLCPEGHLRIELVPQP